MLLFSREQFQNYSHLNYGPFSLDIMAIYGILKMFLFRKF